jgi:HAD superfamily hydrolase (TIGR01509 family)
MPAVLMDLDGSLLDTEKMGREAEARISIRLLGYKYTEYDYRQLIGHDMRRTAEYLIARAQSDRTWEEVAEAIRVETFHLIRNGDGIKAMPGAHALLLRIREAGLRSALVTSTDRKTVRLMLNRMNWDFKVIIDAQSVDFPKPDPQPYKMAASLLGLSPEECDAIEDSPPGAASALEAGCRHVYVIPSDSQFVFEDDERLSVVRSLDRIDVNANGLISK